MKIDDILLKLLVILLYVSLISGEKFHMPTLSRLFFKALDRGEYFQGHLPAMAFNFVNLTNEENPTVSAFFLKYHLIINYLFLDT